MIFALQVLPGLISCLIGRHLSLCKQPRVPAELPSTVLPPRKGAQATTAKPDGAGAPVEPDTLVNRKLDTKPERGHPLHRH